MANVTAGSEVPGLVDRLADQAANEITSQIYQRHPELLQRFGEKGKSTCRQDLIYHIEYLSSSLYGDDSPFRDYARWLANVLESRGVPVGHLQESLLLMQGFFREQLPAVSFLLVDSVLQAGIDALADTGGEPPTFRRLMPEPLPQSGDYLQALLDGNRLRAQETVLSAMRNRVSLVDVSIAVVQPAMYEIGALWQRNHITVAQEHMATAITQNILAQAFTAADFAAPLNRKALFACVQGNHHSLGLRMVSDAFEVTGWHVQFLGADVPTQDMVAQISRWRPEVIGLSLSLPSHIKAARAAIEQLRGELGNQCPAILVGGVTSNQVDGLWKAVGADAWAANARDSLKEIA